MTLTCAICGASFAAPGHRGSLPKTCSDVCKDERRRRYIRAYKREARTRNTPYIQRQREYLRAYGQRPEIKERERARAEVRGAAQAAATARRQQAQRDTLHAAGYLTAQEAAAYVDIAYSTLLLQTHKGVIAHEKMGRANIYALVACDEYIANHRGKQGFAHPLHGAASIAKAQATRKHNAATRIAHQESPPVTGKTPMQQAAKRKARFLREFRRITVAA